MIYIVTKEHPYLKEGVQIYSRPSSEGAKFFIESEEKRDNLVADNRIAEWQIKGWLVAWQSLSFEQVKVLMHRFAAFGQQPHVDPEKVLIQYLTELNTGEANE